MTPDMAELAVSTAHLSPASDSWINDLWRDISEKTQRE